jgi:hypothetical protein
LSFPEIVWFSLLWLDVMGETVVDCARSLSPGFATGVHTSPMQLASALSSGYPNLKPAMTKSVAVS